MKRVLVLGGSGTVGGALLQELHGAGATGAFTYHTQEGRARELEAATGFLPFTADLRDPRAVPDLFRRLADRGLLPEGVVHCASAAPPAALGAIDLDSWEALQSIHGRAALQCAQEMAARGLRGALVLVAALDGLERVPAPAHVAASQGALQGLAYALAKELGPKGILVNLAVLGVLEAGISAALDPDLRAAYPRHAALGRTGTAAEAARGLRWLVLENTYLNGARFPLTGGLG